MEYSYKFKIIYQDDDNDEPWNVNLNLEDQVTSFAMARDLNEPTNDGIFSDGELYIVTVAGAELYDIPHNEYKTIYYNFSTYDYYPELDLHISFVKTKKFSDLKVINNVKPTVRNNLPAYWVLQEDSKPAYIKLFKIFSDRIMINTPGKKWNSMYGVFIPNGQMLRLQRT